MTVPIPEPERSLITRTARSVTIAGATLSGAARRAVAVSSRAMAAAGDDTPPDGNPVVELVWRLTVAPHTVRRGWVERITAGIGPVTYLEILGVVARLRAVDTFCFAVGVPTVELPPAAADAPTGEVAVDASPSNAWLPTVGPASPPTALSAVPAEDRSLHDLHGVFYLPLDRMTDLDVDRGLHRTQMELVAARTSLLNECFF